MTQVKARTTIIIINNNLLFISCKIALKYDPMRTSKKTYKIIGKIS